VIAYAICGYDYASKEDKFPNRAKATYDDLLSYYNQTDHVKIDRHSIIKALELLISANPDDTIAAVMKRNSRILKRAYIREAQEKRSCWITFFENGYRLPDFTNHNMEQFYVQPDFVYEKEKVFDICGWRYT